MNWKFLIPLAIGAFLVAFNKHLGTGQHEFNEKVIPWLSTGATPWQYRIGYILVGVIAIVIGLTGLFIELDPQ